MHPTELNPDPCLYLSLRKANRVMSQIYDHYLAGCGLKGGQFSILRATTLMGESTNKSLQEVLSLDQTTLSRNLKPLIRDGYMLTREGDDKRVKILTLSQSGKEIYSLAERKWALAQIEIKNKLGADHVDMLYTLTDAVVKLKS